MISSDGLRSRKPSPQNTKMQVTNTIVAQVEGVRVLQLVIRLDYLVFYHGLLTLGLAVKLAFTVQLSFLRSAGTKHLQRYLFCIFAMRDVSLENYNKMPVLAPT